MLSHRLDVKENVLPERAVARVTGVVRTAHLGVEGYQLADLPISSYYYARHKADESQLKRDLKTVAG